MGGFPTHWCHTDDGYRVVSPVSVLDCDLSLKCKGRADVARRGTYFGLERIRGKVEDAKTAVQVALDQQALWELVLEAKLREEDSD